MKFAYKIYVSFSGGIDSTVLLHITRQIYPDVVALYIDTGLEYPEIKQFVKTINNVQIIRPEMSFKEVITNYGYPIISKEVSKRVYEYHNGIKKGKLESTLAYQEFNGIRLQTNGKKSTFNKTKWKFLVDAPFKISHKCCDIMKKKPAKRFEEETGLHPIVGTMADESLTRLSVWYQNGCNAFDSKRPISKPLSFWTKQDILEYIKTYNIPYSEVYGDILQDENGKYYTTGVDGTGCVFCLYGIQEEENPNRLQQLEITHNKLYKYCLKPVEENGLGEGQVLDYLNQHGIKVNY